MAIEMLFALTDCITIMAAPINQNPFLLSIYKLLLFYSQSWVRVLAVRSMEISRNSRKAKETSARSSFGTDFGFAVSSYSNC